MTLTEFLLARIDEDEATARAVVQGLYGPHHLAGELNGGIPMPISREGLDFVNRLGPARVLAECEAKRRIVALYLEAHETAMDMLSLDLGPGRTDVEQARYSAREGAFYQVLMHEAEVYADHPDYNEGWRP